MEQAQLVMAKLAGLVLQACLALYLLLVEVVVAIVPAQRQAVLVEVLVMEQALGDVVTHLLLHQVKVMLVVQLLELEHLYMLVVVAVALVELVVMQPAVVLEAMAA